MVFLPVLPFASDSTWGDKSHFDGIFPVKNDENLYYRYNDKRKNRCYIICVNERRKGHMAVLLCRWSHMTQLDKVQRDRSPFSLSGGEQQRVAIASDLLMMF